MRIAGSAWLGWWINPLNLILLPICRKIETDPSKFRYSEAPLTSTPGESEDQLDLYQTYGLLLAFIKSREIKRHPCSHGTSLEAGVMDIVI